MENRKGGVEVQGYFGKELHFLFTMPKYPIEVHDRYNRPWLYLGKLDEEFGRFTRNNERGHTVVRYDFFPDFPDLSTLDVK